MKCEGRPEDGRCPDNRNDNTVHNTIADMFLCNACEEYRWPTVGATAKLSNSGASVSRKHNTRQNTKSTTGKLNTKKAPNKDRAHAISVSHNAGNNGHNETFYANSVLRKMRLSCEYYYCHVYYSFTLIMHNFHLKFPNYTKKPSLLKK